MSVDLNWEAITGGPGGEALAESIRDFIHEKFQTITLPRFLKSVKVHSFSFGDIPPSLELKDITDPLPDFYEENPDADDADDSQDEEDLVPDLELERRRRTIGGRDAEERFRDGLGMNDGQFWRATTPGVPGGTSNLHYFGQTHLGAGWSSAQTPLAAVAGAHMTVPWTAGSGVEPGGVSRLGIRPGIIKGTKTSGAMEHQSRNPSIGSVVSAAAEEAEEAAIGELRERKGLVGDEAVADDIETAPSAASQVDVEEEGGNESEGLGDLMPRYREPKPEDVQVVFRVKYAGDIRLMLTAEILLDYPMPSFVGIPVKLNVTGLTFDGVGVLAHIRKRVHFCFLSPEDALAAIGPDGNELDQAVAKAAAEVVGAPIGDTGPHRGKKFGGLLQEIRIESEIGQRESGKQSLKNVGKVERFILEQVRRIFEDEFVYPSFWTFLV